MAIETEMFRLFFYTMKGVNLMELQGNILLYCRKRGRNAIIVMKRDV